MIRLRKGDVLSFLPVLCLLASSFAPSAGADASPLSFAGLCSLEKVL